jgi:D-glycero-alpha-D-manno-heptose 1-phosphate guanylyltransferase
MSVENLTALILAGGLGTRLRSVVGEKQKVIAEVNGRPFLFYLLDQLAENGIKEVILCVSFQASVVKEIVGNVYRGMRVDYSIEKELKGTGGAIRQAIELSEAKRFLIMNGDSYCEFLLKAFLATHEKRQAEASILLTQVNDTGRFGSVMCDKDGKILSFKEKEQTLETQKWINAGIYLIERSLIEEIQSEKTLSLEREVFPTWIGRNFFGMEGNAIFIDMGTPESYAQAGTFFASLKKNELKPTS